MNKNRFFAAIAIFALAACANPGAKPGEHNVPNEDGVYDDYTYRDIAETLITLEEAKEIYAAKKASYSGGYAWTLEGDNLTLDIYPAYLNIRRQYLGYIDENPLVKLESLKDYEGMYYIASTKESYNYSKIDIYVGEYGNGIVPGEYGDGRDSPEAAALKAALQAVLEGGKGKLTSSYNSIYITIDNQEDIPAIMADIRNALLAFNTAKGYTSITSSDIDSYLASQIKDSSYETETRLISIGPKILKEAGLELVKDFGYWTTKKTGNVIVGGTGELYKSTRKYTLPFFRADDPSDGYNYIRNPRNPALAPSDKMTFSGPVLANVDIENNNANLFGIATLDISGLKGSEIIEDSLALAFDGYYTFNFKPSPPNCSGNCPKLLFNSFSGENKLDQAFSIRGGQYGSADISYFGMKDNMPQEAAGTFNIDLSNQSGYAAGNINIYGAFGLRATK
ncbi:MAG: hypothetical protein LBL52_00290 [Rickettsiales bacterium]|jgi:hypothetical protein|nr:hypothetical protein [Rickettsiales bacterium]